MNAIACCKEITRYNSIHLLAGGGLVCIALVLGTESTYAADSCEPPVGRMASAQGRIEVQRFGDSNWQQVSLDETLCQGDTVRVGELSRAAVALINDAILRLDENTTIRLVDITTQQKEKSILDLLFGAFQSFSRKPRLLEVSTPYINGSIEGTEFVFRVDDNHTTLTVFEGTVVASNDQGSMAVAGGESVVAQKGQAPQPRVVVNPRDAAQWALYYPPLLSILDGDRQSLDQFPASLQKAITLAGANEIDSAFSALDKVEEFERDASYYLLRAALLLSVGRVDQALTDIEGSLAMDASDGLGFALRSVIALVQNKSEHALNDANQAVDLSPDSTAAKIALSYAQQSAFRIADARDTLSAAVAQAPENALAWARLAELWLMLGSREQSVAAADKARALAPELARTQITLGFVALAGFENDQAVAAFEKAIALNSADPLPHLGLGLAKISAGKLQQGRADIELAVGLDSSNALLRTYLGKAYFEEKRSPLDAEQLEIAKQLDPFDPTAFLYDGIRKQTKNDPVAALKDLEASIERNDNRAAYRGRLLLDQDRAARGTSLARVYQDLGFNNLGVNESAKSLTLDPSNASAHRFLSDSYRGLRRHEISRVSELLQAQLMQNVNINPVQPSVSETNLNIVTLGGPASAGFNEFTPLFAQNKAQFNISGFAGNNDTQGAEAVASGLVGGGSFSVGGYTYESDGWRPNNGLDRDIINLFAQVALTPKINIQAEYRSQDSTAGDLAFNFDPDNFLLDKTDERDQDTVRLGLRYTPTPRSKSNFLFSYINNDRDETLSQSEQLDPFATLFIDSTVRDKGDQYEAQYIYQKNRLNLVVGAAQSDGDGEIRDQILINDIDFGPVFEVDETIEQTIEHPRAYIYTNIHTGEESVDWTIGASYDDYQEGILEETSFNPKFGVRWNVKNDLQFRAAVFRTVKPLVVNNRTIEPTQVAGFNQFFDDINGTESSRYGLGFDKSLSANLSIGGEVTKRDLDEPIFIFFEEPSRTDFEDREELLHKLYVYWTPFDQLSVTAQLIYDQYKSEKGIATEFDNLPEKVETVSLPIGISYFNSSGFFASVTGTYVDQEVKRFGLSTRGQGEDDFFVVDAAIGYRFAKRRGIASLGVKNLFDEEFNFQDDSFREFRGESSTGPYFPDRIVLGKITLNF